MRAAYKPMLTLMWLALVSMALNYWRTWEIWYRNNSIVNFNLRSQQIHWQAFGKGPQLPILSRKMFDKDPHRRQLGAGNWELLL